MPGMLITCRITDSVLFFVATLHRSAKTPQCSVTFNLRSNIIPNFTSISCILSLCLLCIHPNSNPTLIISCCTNPLAAMPWTWPMFKETSIQLQPEWISLAKFQMISWFHHPCCVTKFRRAIQLFRHPCTPPPPPPPPHTHPPYI